MAGATSISGDVYNHDAGNVIGGDDLFTIAKSAAFSTPTSITAVTGDVFQASGTAATKGGNDIMSIKDAVVGHIVGDVYSSNGNVTAGNDQIVFASSAPFYSGPPTPMPASPAASYLVGDVYQMTGGGLVGGDDAIAVTNANANAIVGDVYSMSGTTNGQGGADTITVTWTRSICPPPPSSPPATS